ncbi:calcium-binding protein [Salipiger mucosus]|uniref:Alkaline phosphatase n=1 Tax=Salipiger mucosus DSM 16094 TaxID=1123237 RepID=S9QF36_9RHOB|nr:calcium-binding protein [Salipiger mucosus]EPX78512.1 hypothetical protein Salmuc_03623 [Salipiger mucosus DSM 16094]
MPSIPEEWLSEFTINDQDSGPSGDDQYDPVTIQLTNGNIVTLWTDASDAGAGSDPGLDIVGQIYDPLGNPVGGEFRANGTFANDEFHFDATPLEDGRFVVAYTDQQDGSNSTNVIRATEWTTNSDGTIGTSSTVAIASRSEPGEGVFFPTVTSDSTGGYQVAWTRVDYSHDDADDIEARYVDAAGTVGPQFTLWFNSDTNPGPLDSATTTDGEFVVVGERARASSPGDVSIVYSLSDSTGRLSAGIVSDTISDGWIDRDASVAALAGSGFVVSWTNFGDYGEFIPVEIQFQRFDNAGNELGGAVSIASGDEYGDNHTDYRTPDVFALADGGFVVSHNVVPSSNYQTDAVRLNRFDASGTLLASREMASAEDGYSPPSGTGLADGRFFLSWITESSGDADVQGAIFDPRDAPNASGVYGPTPWTLGTIGDDTISGGVLSENLQGWTGDDLLQGGDGDDTIGGGAGADTLDGGTGLDVIDGGSGLDNLAGGAGGDTVRGGDGNDTIYGDADDDSLYGDGGTDTLLGGSGTDRLEGGDDGDLLLGGSNSDTLKGDAGDDTLNGEGGYDTVLYAGIYAPVYVNLESGTATGGAGTDTLLNIENVFGGASNDVIYGTNAHGNRLEGSSGNDTIYGLDGRDTILGGNSNDRLYGGDDVDKLLGGAQDDFLDGGGATDFLTGGSGADTFVLRDIADTGVGRWNRDEIRDFDAAEGDVINVFLVDADATTGGNQAFTYAGTSFTGTAGELILNDYVLSGVDVTIASMDVDGDAVIDGQLYIVGGAVIGDFVL